MSIDRIDTLWDIRTRDHSSTIEKEQINYIETHTQHGRISKTGVVKEATHTGAHCMIPFM